MEPSPAFMVSSTPHRRWLPPGSLPLILSLLVQLLLGFFLGHAYDMRIFMSTGYLVATGQDPYIARDLSSIFQDASFQHITSLGYPPPWALVLGLIYLATYKILPNLLLYNLAIKLPIITANLCLAYLVAKILKKLGAEERTARNAWMFMLFNPLLLLATSAWGQIDSMAALFALLALLLLSEGKLADSAALLALAVAFKPTTLPLIPAVFIFLPVKPILSMLRYFAVFCTTLLVLCIGPFLVFRWDPTPVLLHWNAFFTVGGGLSFMAFLQLWKDSYQLPGWWWLVGLLWVPALGTAALTLRRGGKSFPDLLMISTALILVFFLFRTWLSEPNIVLLLPIVLILTRQGRLDRRTLTAIWVLPLLFGLFNTSIFQLLFPSLPGLMERLLNFSETYQEARLILQFIVVVPWLVTGAWIVLRCYKDNRGIRIQA